MNELESLRDILPLLIPIFIIQVILIVVALRDLMGPTRVRGPRWLWVIIIVFVNLLGPILYLVIGRNDE